MPDAGLTLEYRPPGPVAQEYLFSEDLACLIQGPRGSGKSVATVNKLLKNAVRQQEVAPKLGLRRTLVIRDTYDNLNRTALQTWLGRFPEEVFGVVRREKPYMHRIERIPGLVWEVYFLAIEDENALRKLLSQECSDAWVNEFREMPLKVLTDLVPCLRLHGKQGFMPQINADTNAPASNHWWAMMSNQVPPPADMPEEEAHQYRKRPGWRFFIQPPAAFERRDEDSGDLIGYDINPAAENLHNLPDGYYEKMIDSMSRAEIRVNVLNKPALLSHGKPVWPTFREDLHVAEKPLEPVPGHPILVGVDFGVTPAAVFCQRPFDKWYVLHEVVGDRIGANTFAAVIKRILAERYPGFDYIIYGDPAGIAISQSDAQSPFMMFRAAGLPIQPAPTNDPAIRIAAVENVLKRLPDGSTRILLCPSVIRVQAAMAGDYQYAKLRTSDGRYQSSPLKNDASHIADAVQYVIVGAGEGRALLSSSTSIRSGVVVAPRSRGWSALRGRA